jgi:hypothetical protein
MRECSTEAQLAFALLQAANGTDIAEFVLNPSVTEQTFCRWMRLKSDLGVPEIRQPRQFEVEKCR